MRNGLSPLRKARFLKGLTQYDLTMLTNINSTRISLIENNYVKPRCEEVFKLSRVLDVKPDELFPGEKHGPSSQS